MKNISGIWLFVIAVAMTLSSCDIVGGLVEFGIWVGIAIVVLVVGIILWLVNRFKRRR